MQQAIRLGNHLDPTKENLVQQLPTAKGNTVHLARPQVSSGIRSRTFLGRHNEDLRKEKKPPGRRKIYVTGKSSGRRSLRWGVVLRTPGHKGFMTPRAESPHGRKHHKDQQAPRTAEPHRQESRTGRTGAGELSAYGTKLRQQPKPAREERPQGTQEGQKTTRDGKTAREAGPQGLDDLVGSQSRKKCGI